MARAARGAAQRVEAEEQAGGALDAGTAATRHVALLAAIIATGGSLFFSEVLGWIPCELCWVQRIFMYPLVVILGVGILRDDRGLHMYALPLSLTGMGFSLFHYLQVLKVIAPSACQGGVPCSVDYLTPILTGPFSFIKIPFLALVAFAIISVMMGNYALAGAPATPAGARRASGAAAVAIVAVTVAVFLGLALMARA
ncbi:MAG TPA: disulfide bond formation protein B [Chloroflexaceae bacterium]|nr:disulfide bond formation protein B [Chloroflexaceae bacterium]